MKKLFFNVLIICLFNIGVFSQVNNSVLSTGNWYKLRIQESGVYKITYNELQNLGIDVGAINPEMVKLFGNENGMLPEINGYARPDDLNELAIWVEGEGDGSFDPGDYILFYGQSPTKWRWDASQTMFIHEQNLYDDYSFYFLTISTGTGKRIQDEASLTSETTVSNTFDDFHLYEKDTYNLINSGKQWVGDVFSDTSVKTYSFYSPNIAAGSQAIIKSRFVARSNVNSSFNVNCENGGNYTVNVPAVNYGSNTLNFADEGIEYYMFSANDDTVDIQINFSFPDINSKGWLDYLCLNTRRNLSFTSPQMPFRDIENVGVGNITKYNILNISANERIWNITDIHNIKNQQFNISGSDGWFITETDSLKEYIAFTNAGFLSVDSIYQIPNQNLHALSSAELLIISHPDFITEAQQLESHHETFDNLTTHTVNVFDIYNEFSSGRQDISAVRDFIKHMYDKGLLKYVLLFGDASYDYKNRISNNKNFVPTWQSENSIRFTSSFCSDDFFGLMGFTDGGSTGNLDIGVGRIPVSTSTDAYNMITKIIDYATNSDHMGIWRSDILFVGDDNDFSQHMMQSDNHSDLIKTDHCCFNQSKIYLDNYPITYSSSTYSCIAGKDSLISKINNGQLIVNYTGHGNISSIAHENILSVDSLNVLHNQYNLPFFIAATANTNRYDDPQVESLGKSIFLNPVNGGIASFSASRLTYSTPNYVLNHEIFEQNIFETDSLGKYPRLGDVIKKAKINSGGGFNKRMYVLLGDPALRLAIPENKIIIDQINGASAASFNDTIYVGENISITGHLEDNLGNSMSSFNGTCYYRLYDTETTDSTLGNLGNPVYTFQSQETILYSGSCSVNGGQFTFNFPMPSGAQMLFSNGKLSLYSTDLATDAKGCHPNLFMSQLADINTIDHIANMLIYPTLTSDFITIRSSENLNNYRILINGIDGRQYCDIIIDNYNPEEGLKVDVQSLDQGMYILSINNGLFRKSCKIIKQ